MPTNQPSLNLESLYRPLWLTYGLVPLLAGLDKFFNLLTDWPKYLSPWMANLLPVSAQAFMYIVGIIAGRPGRGHRWSRPSASVWRFNRSRVTPN